MAECDVQFFQTTKFYLQCPKKKATKHMKAHTYKTRIKKGISVPALLLLHKICISWTVWNRVSLECDNAKKAIHRSRHKVHNATAGAVHASTCSCTARSAAYPVYWQTALTRFNGAIWMSQGASVHLLCTGFYSRLKLECLRFDMFSKDVRRNKFGVGQGG